MTDAARPPAHRAPDDALQPLPAPIDPAVAFPAPALYFVTSVPPGPASQFVDVENDAAHSLTVGNWTHAPGMDDLQPHERFAALRVTGPQFAAALLPGVSFAVRLDEVRDGAQINDHVRVAVFAGPDPEHRAQCGMLVMRRPEAEALQALLGAARR